MFTIEGLHCILSVDVCLRVCVCVCGGGGVSVSDNVCGGESVVSISAWMCVCVGWGGAVCIVPIITRWWNSN